MRNAVLDIQQLAKLVMRIDDRHTWYFDFESDTRPSGSVNAHAELCIGARTVRISLRYLDRYVKGCTRWDVPGTRAEISVCAAVR